MAFSWCSACHVVFYWRSHCCPLLRLLLCRCSRYSNQEQKPTLTPYSVVSHFIFWGDFHDFCSVVVKSVLELEILSSHQNHLPPSLVWVSTSDWPNPFNLTIFSSIFSFWKCCVPLIRHFTAHYFWANEFIILCLLLSFLLIPWHHWLLIVP